MVEIDDDDGAAIAGWKNRRTIGRRGLSGFVAICRGRGKRRGIREGAHDREIGVWAVVFIPPLFSFAFFILGHNSNCVEEFG